MVKGVTIKNKQGKEWNYPNKKNETVIIDSVIKDNMARLCKTKNINKSKLVEEFYKTIILRMNDGSINANNGYVTINILRKPIV